jgi:hypothetical protein
LRCSNFFWLFYRILIVFYLYCIVLYGIVCLNQCYQAWNFKMASKFKMNAQTILSFKTCKFNYFLKFFQDWLNLANCSSSTKKFFFLKFKMAEKFNMADFLHKNSWFFGSGSGTAEWNVLNFGYVILLALFYCKKKLLPVLKNQNGIYIQDGVGNVDNFHAIFSKMIFCPFFFGFF